MNFAVTVVESGTRALQYLGLDGENSSFGFDVSKSPPFLDVSYVICS